MFNSNEFVSFSQLFCVFCAFVGGSLGNTPIVQTPLGDIQGSLIASRKGQPILSFRGIKYGQAERFQPSKAAGKWTGLYNATQDGPICPQPSADPTSEDCLFLNVYTTQLPNETHHPKQPVIVFIHPGGFYMGGGPSYWQGPHYLLDHPITLVTFNYRLGSLGFISTNDSSAPGNNGLKDQVLVLKWIQNNIAHFGGDPQAVTLAGYSAGGISAILHMVSPMSKGLFHRVISMSGSPLSQWPVANHQLNLARLQAKFVNCTSDDIIGCLKTKSAHELGDSLLKFVEFGIDPILKWTYVIERDFGQERFLVEHPIKSIATGNYHKVPVMLGITKDEFAWLAFNVLTNSTLTKEMNDDWDRIAPISFQYERSSENSRKISKHLKALYLQNQSLQFNQSLAGLGQIYADALIGFGVHRAAKMLAQTNSNNVFYYRFSYQGRYSHFYWPNSNNTAPFGVVHHDDLIYLFYGQKLFPFIRDTDPEVKMVERMTLLWTNFARFGNPTPKIVPLLDNQRWIPYGLETREYFEIAEKLAMNGKLYEKRYKEWEQLFPVEQYS